MSPKPVDIHVDPDTRPCVPTIVAFPGEEVIFASHNGDSTFFFPEGNQIFEGSESVVFLVESGNSVSRQVKTGVIDDSDNKETVARRGALFVEYAVHCTKDGETYFAEGNSAPKIIIPRFP